MAGSAGIPNWLQLLKDLVATGKGMAGLKDLKGWNLQPERNKMDSYLEFMACKPTLVAFSNKCTSIHCRRREE